MDILVLAQQCAPHVEPQTMAAIVAVESSNNPYAIGVVDGYLPRQPATEAEAIATAQNLAAYDWNYSVGLAQINQSNFERYGLSIEQAFDPCTNLRIGGLILAECFTQHADSISDPQGALRDAISCYYSGNYTRGHVIEAAGTSYVQRVLNKSAQLQ